MLSLNKKVDKQNSHSNVEQNHHDNEDRAVGLRGREREKERGRVSIIRTHTPANAIKSTQSYLCLYLTAKKAFITTVGR